MDKLSQLPEVVTIFRGCGENLNEDGISFSLEMSVAQKFAYRTARLNKTKPVLITAQVAKSRILGYLSARGEEEIVLLPKASLKILSKSFLTPNPE